MPDASSVLVFSAAAVVLLLIPGPAVLYVVTRSVSHGRRAGLVSVLALHTGSAVHITAAVAGLSALIVASATAFNTVRYAGAAYLLYLGIRTLLAKGSDAPASRVQQARLGRVYLDGLLVAILNPKTAVFILAFLPQFAQSTTEIIALGVVFIAIGVLSDSGYALAASAAGGWLRRQGSGPSRTQRYVTGAVYLGLAGVAALTPARRT